jgi:hypothetical protein
MTVVTMHPVKSSQILSVGYDQSSEILYIEFLNWTVYEYYSVTPDIASAILSPSTSVGSYFYKEIKGKFEYKKLESKVNNGMLKP